MNIYTKTGDKGRTSLVSGQRVSKNHPRVESYGNVDELISHLALLRVELEGKNITDHLRRIQAALMLGAAHLATDGHVERLKPFEEGEITFLEGEIDSMQSELPPQTAFILPAGPRAAAVCHIARTVCRRAERSAIPLLEDEKLVVVVKYLNRLSDYLFVYARYIAWKEGVTDDFWHQ